jgi:hypothetical protein
MTQRLEFYVRFTNRTGRVLYDIEDTPRNRRDLDREAAHWMSRPTVESVNVEVRTGRSAGYERSR